MSPSTVNVSGISSSTSEKEVRDFFSFCGKIKNITIKDESGSKHAEVAFEKESAAKTALLLDSTQLGDAQVHVTSAAGVDPMSGKHDHDEEQDIAQEDKPRSRIMAEYLAHGYRLGDNVIQRGIAFDSQHGISNRFVNTLTNFDKKYDASGKTKSVDEKYQISDKAYGAFGGLQSYFEQALDTPTGQKLRSFYESGAKQVQDVHSEAMRLSGLNNKPVTVSGTSRTTCKCGSDTKNCPCAPGTCACSSCAKNKDEKDTSSSTNEPHQIKGTDRTACNCKGDSSNCPCSSGACACSGCTKNADISSSSSGGKFTPQDIKGTERTACKCQANDKVCGCAPGSCSCSSCKLNPDSAAAGSENKPQKVAGSDRTTCNCGADTKNCPCAPGTCACASCAKNPQTKAGASAEEMDMHKVGGDRTECKCGSNAEKCPCAPGTCSCGSCAKNPDEQKA